MMTSHHEMVERIAQAVCDANRKGLAGTYEELRDLIEAAMKPTISKNMSANRSPADYRMRLGPDHAAQR